MEKFTKKISLENHTISINYYGRKITNVLESKESTLNKLDKLFSEKKDLSLKSTVVAIRSVFKEYEESYLKIEYKKINEASKTVVFKDSMLLEYKTKIQVDDNTKTVFNYSNKELDYKVINKDEKINSSDDLKTNKILSSLLNECSELQKAKFLSYNNCYLIMRFYEFFYNKKFDKANSNLKNELKEMLIILSSETIVIDGNYEFDEQNNYESKQLNEDLLRLSENYYSFDDIRFIDIADRLKDLIEQKGRETKNYVLEKGYTLLEMTETGKAKIKKG